MSSVKLMTASIFLPCMEAPAVIAFIPLALQAARMTPIQPRVKLRQSQAAMQVLAKVLQDTSAVAPNNIRSCLASTFAFLAAGQTGYHYYKNADGSFDWRRRLLRIQCIISDADPASHRSISSTLP